MATLPRPTPSCTDLDREAEALYAQVGTPEFEAEYRRQMARIAEHDRRNHGSNRMEVDWAALGDWE